MRCHLPRDSGKDKDKSRQRTLITSNGLFPKVEKQPAVIPPKSPRRGVIGFSPSLVTIRLYSLNHINRKPWLDPCFSAVAKA